jgi:muconolactone delta-isomerase
MLYHLDVEIDYMGLGERRDMLLRAEWAKTQELIDRGIAVAEWRKASGRGVIAVWDVAGHDELNELLRSLPLSPWLTRVEATPLIDHPLWPGGRLKPST